MSSVKRLCLGYGKAVAYMDRVRIISAISRPSENEALSY
jgi:hypothetical protein